MKKICIALFLLIPFTIGNASNLLAENGEIDFSPLAEGEPFNDRGPINGRVDLSYFIDENGFSSISWSVEASGKEKSLFSCVGDDRDEAALAAVIRILKAQTGSRLQGSEIGNGQCMLKTSVWNSFPPETEEQKAARATFIKASALSGGAVNIGFNNNALGIRFISEDWILIRERGVRDFICKIPDDHKHQIANIIQFLPDEAGLLVRKGADGECNQVSVWIGNR